MKLGLYLGALALSLGIGCSTEERKDSIEHQIIKSVVAGYKFNSNRSIRVGEYLLSQPSFLMLRLAEGLDLGTIDVMVYENGVVLDGKLPILTETRLKEMAIYADQNDDKRVTLDEAIDKASSSLRNNLVVTN